MPEDKKRKKGYRRTAADTYPISSRVTLSMLAAIDVVLKSGQYLRVSDYLRDLVRKDLAERGIPIK